ncbi:plasmid recombination protein [Brevibacterium sp. W7.2]|uniref:plasmid recombination protein n=1 Tax=Brevibacterium sp. W7.2 TaxID=2823518 RepID=UPI002012C59C|nr:plasmid recombination protein [Brevibacterium sp. W7.2]
MSYTATFDASHKVKAAGSHRVASARQIARDVDQAAGFDFGHRNPNIDPTRTWMNITMVDDGNGGWRTPVVTQAADGNDRPPSAELLDYLDTRLATVKKRIKADAVAIRPLILQLDPKWFAEHNPDWRDDGLNAEAERYIESQIAWAVAEFGHENLPGFSVHMDETHPQLQLLTVPVTEDGRLSQKDFFKGPGDLQRQHKEHRQVLADSGYDVEFKVTARSKEHLSSSEYATSAHRLLAGKTKLARDQDELNARAVKVRVRESDVTAAERDLMECKTQAEQEGRKSGFERGYEAGRAAGEESVRADLIALDILSANVDTPLLPRRRAPKPPPEKLTPARERYLSYTRQLSK